MDKPRNTHRPWKRNFAAALMGSTLLFGGAGMGNAAPDAATMQRLPQGPGRDLFANTCSQCHALGTAISKNRTSEGWTGIIQQMIGHGANIDSSQQKIIHDYLASNFAETETGPTNSVADVAAAANKQAGGHYPRPTGPDQWPAYGGGGANQNYSPLTQITPANVASLKQAWVYHYGAGLNDQGDQGLDYRFEATPLIIGDVMYISTPSSPLKPGLKSTITALRPETGKVLWKFESPLNIHGRGIAYWPGDANTPPRIFFGTDKGMIMAVDVTTGKLAKGFGRNGVIDAYVGVVSNIVGEADRSTYTIPNPVTIYKDLVITGSRPGEAGPPGPRGDIRAFDARTGHLIWDFHTVPQPGEPHHDTYSDDEWRDVSGANVWSTMTLDTKSGTLYASTGDLNSYAKGPELYSDSLLAIDAATGKLKWYHQITHHDIWDWDSPTPPILLDVSKDGKTVPAVAITGKHSLFFLFDRRDGTPLNGFEERPTPQPSTPSDQVWPTQPFPTSPGPLARIRMTRDEVPNLVPGMRAYCQKFWDDNHIVSEPLYGLGNNPDHATISYPSATGGPNWGGASFNPKLSLYIVNIQNRPRYSPKAAPGAGPIAMMMHRPQMDAAEKPQVRQRRRGGVRPFTFVTKDGVDLSCGALPWGALVAVNVDTQKIAWSVPLGSTEALGAKGQDTGAPNLGGNITTASGLVFIGATSDRRFRAFDAKTGKQLWETKIDAGAHSTPVTYMGKDGKQYVVVAVGGGTSAGGPHMADELVAYALP